MHLSIQKQGMKMNKTMKKNTINPYIIIGIILLIIPMAISIIGNILSSYDPLKQTH